MRTGGVYEVRTPIDLCGNLADVQEIMPDMYGYDEAGNCELLSQDVCNNIAAVQTSLPDALLQDTDGGCYADTCSNLDGLQREAPEGYKVDEGICEALESRGLWLSELLSNVAGSDAGNEFIELYNPNDEPIELKGYVLQLGKTYETSIVLEGDETIQPRSFAIYRDDELGFTLLNTTDNIRLVAPAGSIVSETSYSEPADDESWAFIDGAWQYTNRVTPNAVNLARFVEMGEVESAVSVQSCPVGKYRHPITNRCRNIEGDAAMLVACDVDEYRNPDTNRCRKIASLTATLAPCNDGYERNPDTNRCRKVDEVSASLASCQAGYERNPETNRCRKAVSPIETFASAPAANTNDGGGSFLKNALIITAGVGAVSYGLYEWRSELARGLRRILSLVSRK